MPSSIGIGTCHSMRMPSRTSPRVLTSGAWLIHGPPSVHSRPVQMTGHVVSGGSLQERRLRLRAAGKRVWTPRMEPTSGRRIERARHLAEEDDLLPRIVGVRGERV